MTENPLAKLGDLSMPATVLIEKISDAVGGIFKPYQIVRVTRAEAEADRIRAESQIQVTDLHRRAMHRFLEEEAKKQSNIEAITQNALPLLEDKSASQNVADDWITNFFDKSRIVSDNEMQQLWSRILAGEANAPGAFTKRTVNLLADLDKEDAELFMRLCGFGWMIGDVVPLVFDVQGDMRQLDSEMFAAAIHTLYTEKAYTEWIAEQQTQRLTSVFDRTIIEARFLDYLSPFLHEERADQHTVIDSAADGASTRNAEEN